MAKTRVDHISAAPRGVSGQVNVWFATYLIQLSSRLADWDFHSMHPSIGGWLRLLPSSEYFLSHVTTDTPDLNLDGPASF